MIVSLISFFVSLRKIAPPDRDRRITVLFAKKVLLSCDDCPGAVPQSADPSIAPGIVSA